MLLFMRLKASDLVKHYEARVYDLHRRGNVQIEVMNLKQICEQYDVQYRNRDTTSIINDLCEELSEELNDGPIHLFMDEVIIENPNCSCPIDLLGKSPFVLDGEVLPWSDLDSQAVNLMVCVSPESQDLPQLLDLDFDTLSALKEGKPDQGVVPTIPMWRVFRCTKAIHLFLQELQEECSSEHQEFGYQIPPHMSLEGHEISGCKPIWIEVPEHQHMKCARSNCKNCFLVCIEERLEFILDDLNIDGIPNEDILLIVNSSALTKNCHGTFEMEYLKAKYPNLKIKSNFEFDGCESKVVIVIRNGGLLSFSLSNAMSRAVSRLIIFSPDDHEILKKCAQKHLLIQKNLMGITIDNSWKSEATNRGTGFLQDQYCSSKTTQTSQCTDYDYDAIEMYKTIPYQMVMPFNMRIPSSARPSVSITEDSRASSLLSLDSGVSGIKSPKTNFPKMNQFHPDVLNTLTKVVDTYDIPESYAHSIMVDIGNGIFGQTWGKEEEFRRRTSTY